MTTTNTLTVTVLIDGKELVRQVQGTRWRRDDHRNVWIYDENDEPVMEIDGEHFVEIVREDRITQESTSTSTP